METSLDVLMMMLYPPCRGSLLVKSLLIYLEQTAGREAFSGDIFLHSFRVNREIHALK